MAGFMFNLPTAKRGLFRDATTKLKDRLARALQLSVHNFMANVKEKGDIDIRHSGKFSARWRRALIVDSIPRIQTQSDQYEVRVYFDSSIPYAHVHEFGATIRAKGTLFGPALLWIPLKFAKVPRSRGGGKNAGRMTAQEYGNTVSRLFRVNRKGKAPLLLDVKQGKPRYFGIPAVTLKQRFNLRDITKREFADFKATYAAAVLATAPKTRTSKTGP